MRPAGQASILHPLEQRLLLAGISLKLDGSNLRVTGTNHNDSIIIRLDHTRLRVNKLLSVPAAKIRTIFISTRGGNDLVRFDPSTNSLNIRAEITGDAGNDTLSGTPGP